MIDDLPTIGDLAKRLQELGGLRESELEEFKRLELTALSSERKEDALLVFGRLPDGDPAKDAMSLGLAELREWIKERVDGASRSEPPVLYFVSGAPGSGKSAMMDKLAIRHPGILRASADDFKERFKLSTALALEGVSEPAKSNLGRSVYIHRLTAMPSWEMVDMAIDQGVDLAVEMLGMGAADDARTLRRAMAKGYRVEAIHVGCSVEQSLSRAARRHFDQKIAGHGGRWIGLAQAAGRQSAIVSAFASLCGLMAGTEATMRLFDNSGARMAEIWNSEQGGSPPVEMFTSWRRDPKLWRPGANPASDMCAFAMGPDGRWKVALIERSHEPCKGSWAFPGGFIKGVLAEGPFEWGPEMAMQAALRRFSEETLCALDPVEAAFVGKFDAIERDPRNGPNRWVESWLFCAKLDSMPGLAGGDAARSARWADLEECLAGKVELAFDHAKLMELARAVAFGPGAPALSAPKPARPGP